MEDFTPATQTENEGGGRPPRRTAVGSSTPDFSARPFYSSEPLAKAARRTETATSKKIRSLAALELEARAVSLALSQACRDRLAAMDDGARRELCEEERRLNALLLDVFQEIEYHRKYAPYEARATMLSALRFHREEMTAAQLTA